MAMTVSLIALPLASFFILLLLGFGLSKWLIKLVGVLGIALSACCAFALLFKDSVFKRYILWQFLPEFETSKLAVDFALVLDPLSLTMALVVSFVSLWIALYSTKYMDEQEGLVRYFALITVFVAFMLTLVLADNLWLLFIGWEGVSICSYLLIGFYYREKDAEKAAMKAFLTTRIGDIFFIFGIFLCATVFKTLDISTILSLATKEYPHGSFIITLICLCFLGGAVGKSAQLPLHTWLADAMWGPTPVSALIHAATMVTAGVYLIARLSGLFALSEISSMIVLSIGAITLIMGSICALFQQDLKRILAYSTMSQIGMMFLGLGSFAYLPAIFHLVTHAFFKALLFLSAGIIGHTLHTYDVSKMGGLKKTMPFTFAMFLIGALSLVGFPLVSSGFFSKEWILSTSLNVPRIGPYVFAIGCLGAFLTTLYTCRMIILVFFGKAHTKAHEHLNAALKLPLMVLAVFSIAIGFLQTPQFFGHIAVVSQFFKGVFAPSFGLHHEESLMVFLIPSMLVFIGIGYSLLRYKHSIAYATTRSIANFIRNGFGFNRLYAIIFVNPYIAFSAFLKNDFIESLSNKLLYILRIVVDKLHILHKNPLSYYVPFTVLAALTFVFAMVF